MTIFTIGHSTRALTELLALLREQGIARLADIRRYPGSRRHPHFSSEALSVSLPADGVEYVHMPSLGGRRKPEPDSPNTFWRNEQFRAYADHMASAEFRTAVEELLASAKRTAYMCAEAVPWRCHRNLLSDELVRRHLEVLHILGPGSVQSHVINPAARAEGDHLIYPAEAEQKRMSF
jgi:uncharacterized protein (DUF488 family)